MRPPATPPVPRTAMVLAAGLGTRMQPLTADTPKALLRVAGRTLLDYALDRLCEAGVTRLVVNAHWHAEQIAARLRARAAREHGEPGGAQGHAWGGVEMLLQSEPVLLGTGGAVREALTTGALGTGEPFLVVNGDSLWLDGPVPAIERLRRGFDRDRHDALLLVARTATVIGPVGAGDFAIDEAGRLRRRRENEIVPYVYAGVQMLSPRPFAHAPAAPFCMNLIWDRALADGRIAAVVHDGPWFHLSRPVDIGNTERALRDPLFGPSST